MEFRRSLGVFEWPELLESSGMGSSLALSCNIRLFVRELDYVTDICSKYVLSYGYILLDMVALLFNACIA